MQRHPHQAQPPRIGTLAGAGAGALPARSRRGFRLTDRDRELLGFIAAQRFVLACQAQAFLECDRAVAYRRLTALRAMGLLSYRRIFHAQPGVFAVTHGGLAVIDSPLPRPAVDLGTYRHDVGAAWLWLAAHRGRFGAAGRVWSERELRSRSQRDDDLADEVPYGFAVDGRDRTGRPRVHHPDVLAVEAGGAATALELELSLKARRRLESIMLGYGCASWAQRVVYLTDRRRVATVVGEVGKRFGLDGRLSVVYLPEREGDPEWWLWRSISGRRGGTR